MNHGLSVTILTDNTSSPGKGLKAEYGFSCLVQTNGQSVLFDTGWSDLFLRNAQILNVSLNNITSVVLSHGHVDHSGGLKALIDERVVPRNTPLLGCPEIFFPRRLISGEAIGSIVTSEEADSYFNVQLSAKPIWLTEQLVFLGRIERKLAFETNELQSEVLVDGGYQHDEILDDSALAYKSANGLIIIVGCSHSGICNIIEYAKKVCSEDRVVDIIGGLHLIYPKRIKIKKTMDHLSRLKLNALHACHCTSSLAKCAFKEVLPQQGVGVGTIITY